MKRLMHLGVMVLLLAAGAAACREYLPSNRYLQRRDVAPSRSTREASDKFNHAAHAPRLAAAHVTCIDCHHFNVVIDTGNGEMAHELSTHAQHPGSTPCHYCHTNSDTRMAEAPTACFTCHDNLQALRPADHEVAWLKVHASMARANPARCDSCHRQSYCIDCHARRDTIQTRVHDRNFRFVHSIQARANPMQCGSCHRADFCINCHQQGKVDG